MYTTINYGVYMAEVTKSSFTKQPLKRMIKSAGAKRVSDKAATHLGKVMETFAEEVLVKAEKLAENSNRKTVLKEDIRMVVKHKD
tara:strand:- start:2562 stop:2816 length:255 start_codon:yes stop_codon:yes gene_type:complete